MKRTLSFILSLVMVLGVLTSMPVIVSAASGSSYTSSSALAEKLDQIFSGDIDIYSNSACTSEVSMPVGTSMSNSTQYWVKSNTTGNTCSGWQCYIYANAVYNKLFNEWVGHGNSFSHSQNVMTTGKSSVSYSDFVNAGVHTGAYIRTTNQSSGAYNGSSGHSMIVLSYDSTNITYLEGNGDGNGAIRITTKTWSAFNTSQLSGKSRYISHVVQPTETYYQSLYPTSVGTTEKPVDIGDNFYGVILNKAYWKPIHLNPDTSVTLETEAGIANQLWYFDRQDDGSYVISSTLNGNALEMQDGNLNSGTQVVCRSYWGSYYQAWYIYPQGNGYVFVSKHYPEYNLALTLSGNNSADGTKITTETRNNASSQIWNVYSTDEVQLKATTLYATVGDSATDTVFTWDNTYGECAYDLKIWKNEIGQGDAYHLVYSATSGCGVQLPAGTYQAYVDSFNHYQCLRSNVITFTVPEKTCNILYNANGGSGTMSSSTVNYLSEFSLKPGTFTKTGYSFVGWNAYRNSDGKWFVEGPGWQTAEEIASNSYTKKVYQDSVTMTFNDSWFTQLDSVNGTDTFTFYAVWKPNHICVYSGTVTKPATCTEKGIKTFTCSCGDSYTKSIPATGHTESDWFTDYPATVYKAGSKHKECTECSEILETATIKHLKCSKPKLKTIANTSNGVKITWGKVSGADTYRVYRKTKNGDWKYLGSTSKTSYTDKKAKSGTKYYYAVRARNEAGNSSLSSSLSKYYLADPTLKTPSSTKSGVSLKWTKTAGAQGYIIYRKTGTGSYKKLKTEKGVSNLSYVDKSAKKGKKYTYKVKAYYSKTYSAYSNTKTIKDKY